MKKLNVAVMSSIFYQKGQNKKRDRILKVLDILKLYSGYDFDLFLLDDGTNDDNLDIGIQNYKTSDYCKSITYVKRTDNKGISKSHNELLELIPNNKYDYICTFDLDVYPPPDFLKKCIEVLEDSPVVSICGVLVEEYLDSNIQNGLYKCTNSNTFYTLMYEDNPNAMIGGACLTLRGKQFKDFRYDERLVTHHTDAYLIYYFRATHGKVCAILDRGSHFNDNFESMDYILLKTKRHNDTKPLALEIISQIPITAKY